MCPLEALSLRWVALTLMGMRRVFHSHMAGVVAKECGAENCHFPGRLWWFDARKFIFPSSRYINHWVRKVRPDRAFRMIIWDRAHEGQVNSINGSCADDDCADSEDDTMMLSLSNDNDDDDNEMMMMMMMMAVMTYFSFVSPVPQ